MERIKDQIQYVTRQKHAVLHFIGLNLFSLFSILLYVDFILYALKFGEFKVLAFHDDSTTFLFWEYI